MDRHTTLAIPADADLRVGDIVAFGAPHRCQRFDKRRQALRVDDELHGLEALPTFF